MSGAGEVLQAAAVAALGAIEGMRSYDGPPVQAAFPYAVVDAGTESDWSHKSGQGRELRLAVSLRDGGERPARVQALARRVEAALGDLGAALPGWQLVSMHYLRTRVVREQRGPWVAVLDYRARMLAVPEGAEPA